MADRSVCIGPARSSESYLNKEAIVTAALKTGCDAVHPGYGFLAERSAFQRLCTENGLLFLGPSAKAIERMGDKIEALMAAKRLNVPTVPGGEQVGTADVARTRGGDIGYPFLLKASAGGGGRGMRIVRKPEEVTAAFEAATAEARAAFGDGRLYLERYIESARHVEVQILGDAHGNVIHLGERDCSTQRRHQKLVEETPSPVVSRSARRSMAEAAIRLARSEEYVGAGTVEFIFDMESGSYYFLEMNTRIQVEHPITEMITGVDLVAEQIRVGSGAPILHKQDEIVFQGHSIECRINAELPGEDFRPSPGRITEWQIPEGPGIRVDSHCFEGYEVPPYYDSMIAKLIVHDVDRKAAIEKMDRALSRFRISGIDTTTQFHRRVINHPDFIANRVTTSWVEQVFMPQQKRL